MKKIEIYNDPRGHLSLRQYDENSIKPEAILKDEDVYQYLSRLSKNQIKDVEFKDANPDIKVVKVKYDNFNIHLINGDELQKHGEYLTPLTDNLKVALEKKRIMEIRQAREKNGNKTSPKTTRKNKHIHSHIIAGVVVAAFLAGGSHLVSKSEDLKDATPKNLSISNSSSIELLDNDVVILDNNNVVDFTTTTETNDNLTTQTSISVSNVSVSNNEVEPEDNLVSVSTTTTTNVTPNVTTNNFDTMINDINNIDIGNTKLQLEYEDRSETDKAEFTRLNYGNIIEKYSKIYGLDPKLVTAVATQERGVHSTVMDSGGATGLMQIQNSVWVNEPVRAYNFELGKVESFVIEKEMLSDVDKNIQIGCMVLQNAMQYMDYNIIAAVQCYNMGYGNVNRVLDAYAADNGMTRKEVLANRNDCGWLDYRNIITVGDQKYVENVLSWIGEEASIHVSSTDNSVISLNVTNQNNMAKVH